MEDKVALMPTYRLLCQKAVTSEESNHAFTMKNTRTRTHNCKNTHQRMHTHTHTHTARKRGFPISMSPRCGHLLANYHRHRHTQTHTDTHTHTEPSGPLIHPVGAKPIKRSSPCLETSHGTPFTAPTVNRRLRSV